MAAEAVVAGVMAAEEAVGVTAEVVGVAADTNRGRPRRRRYMLNARLFELPTMFRGLQ